jgi:hypothetical protein
MSPPARPQLTVRPPPPVSAADMDRYAATGEVPQASPPSPAPEPNPASSVLERIRLASGPPLTPVDFPDGHRTGLVLARRAPLRRRVTFYLSPEIARRCVMLAARMDIQMSEIAEEALQRFFAQIPDDK